MKCFPKLLDKKNYLEFSTMVQIPRFGSDPYLVESEPLGQWLGESYVLQAPSIVLSIREFGNVVLRTVLCTRQLSYGPEQYSIPKPRSHVYENGCGQRLYTQLQASLPSAVLLSKCLNLPKEASILTAREPTAMGLGAVS